MPTHLKEIAMNELFLALAEERRLQAQWKATVRMPGASRPAARRSPTWGERLSQWLGHEPRLRPRHHH